MTKDFSIVTYKTLTNRVEMILHSKINIPSKVLEMAVVMDTSVDKEIMKNVCQKLLKRLKGYSEVFKNVRLNMILWEKEKPVNKVTPMIKAMTDGFYDDYICYREKKQYEELLEYLKLFQARSKIIIFVTDEKYTISDKRRCEEALKPFLSKKIIMVKVGEDGDIIKVN